MENNSFFDCINTGMFVTCARHCTATAQHVFSQPVQCTAGQHHTALQPEDQVDSITNS